MLSWIISSCNYLRGYNYYYYYSPYVQLCIYTDHNYSCAIFNRSDVFSCFFSFYSQLSILFKHNRHVRTEKCKYYPMLKTQIARRWVLSGFVLDSSQILGLLLLFIIIIMSTYNKLHDDYRLFHNINKVLRVSLTVYKHLLCLTNFKMYLLVNNEHLFLLKGLERAFLLITRTFIQSFTKME